MEDEVIRELARLGNSLESRVDVIGVDEVRVFSGHDVQFEDPDGIAALSFPLGPSSRTASPSTAILTPEGTLIGNFPMRDTFTSYKLPNRT